MSVHRRKTIWVVDVYSITKTVDYENTHGVKGDFYRQILLQKKANEDNMPTAVNGVVFNEYEELYTRWDTEKYSIKKKYYFKH